MKPEAAQDSLRSVQWRRFLSAPDAELLEHLYVPALSRAVRYDRCCAYFSSRVLALAARGFGAFIRRLVALADNAPRPAVRLLVNEQLDPDDVQALLATGDTSNLERKLLRSLKKPVEAFEKRRLEMLAWLVKSGLLEVRVGIPRYTGGIVHAKFGIVTDAHGDSISFMGSDNETAEAIGANYEVLEVRPSWEDADHTEHYRAEFERLWSDTHPHVFTLPLPEAVRLKLIKMAPRVAPTEEPARSIEYARAAMVWKFLAAAPYLAEGGRALDATAPVDAWPHQIHVVEETSAAFPSGRLLCDEVGLGKTIEAGLILRRLLAGRGVRRALLLTPAGLLRQWQEELREKGGLVVPVWEKGWLCRGPGERLECEVQTALREPVLLLSREWARLRENRSLLMQAEPWDLVLMDEAHAARRRKNTETGFNSANLLLELLRELQLSGQTRGVLLLSGTPMQIEPWEPWDLLSILGIGGRWLSAFEPVATFYEAVANLEHGDMLRPDIASRVAALIASDPEFGELKGTETDIRRQLVHCVRAQRPELAERLRRGAPLGRCMHRNTRETLREYYEKGLLNTPPPRRAVRDEVYEYAAEQERQVYDAVSRYIDSRYDQLEQERVGKGFVMTIYRRRAASSPHALKRSLERRLEVVQAIASHRHIDAAEAIGDNESLFRDLEELGEDALATDEGIDPGLPTSAKTAKDEVREIEKLLGLLEDLGATDSKRDRFVEILDELMADGRSVLVFSEYRDTMDYLRDQLAPIHGDGVACYSGRGGEMLRDGEWRQVAKSEITAALETGAVKVLVCTDAASEGLNLQSAGALINYDLPWNPSRVEQRIGRIDRIGQQHPVLSIVNLFLCKSVDMAVYGALRRRCGLFERFVGEMQPVLAKARDALRQNPRSAPSVVAEIEKKAYAVETSPAVTHAFRHSRPAPVPATVPLLSRSDLREALRMLESGGLPVRAKRLSDGVWRLSGVERQVITCALDCGTLESNSKAVPLTLGSQYIEQIAAKLVSGSRGSPLVVGEYRKGAYVAREVRWAGQNPRPVRSLAELFKLVDAWDGKPPDPEDVVRAETDARNGARKRVESAAALAQRRYENGLQQQVEAAKLRLRRELARHLRLFGRDDLNHIWAERMQRATTADGRYRKAFDLLGGYVKWTEEEVRDAEDYCASLTGSHEFRMNVAPELEAALNDPRWRARGARRRV